MSYILELKGITKRFGGIQALNNVDFELEENEILGLVGDNGAGKSTLIKIISGVYKPDQGEIYFNNNLETIGGVNKARRLGIETIYQDSGIFENMGIWENIFVGREVVYNKIGRIFGIIDEKFMRKESEKLLSKIRINLKFLNEIAENLSGGERQAVAIARALYWKKKVLLLDEPTAALGVNEAETFLDLILDLKEESGLSIIVIAHNLDHIIRICSRVIVMRQGKRAGTLKIGKDEQDKSKLIAMITGLEFK